MDTKETQERMRDGRLYFCTDENLAKEQLQCLDRIQAYNALRPSDMAARSAMLQTIFAEVGENAYVEIPFRANWGRNTHLGKNFYSNFNLTLVDDGTISIGDDVLIGPNVTIATAGHPIEPVLRKKVAQFVVPVTIGNNVWIGANSVILPGVVIGDNSVIGAGSVVTKDIPSDVVAVGNPCRVLRPIGERDRRYFYRDREIDLE